MIPRGGGDGGKAKHRNVFFREPLCPLWLKVLKALTTKDTKVHEGKQELLIKLRPCGIVTVRLAKLGGRLDRDSEIRAQQRIEVVEPEYLTLKYRTDISRQRVS